jgi:inner membrane protein
MLTPTHLVTAQTAYLGACIVTAHPPAPLEMLIALIGALLPDLDSHNSYVGRILPPASGWVEHQFGHRTLTHSLLAQVGLGLIAWWLLPFGFFLAFVAGWVSHSVADMMTPIGVCWFWPARGRCVLPGAARYRIESMGRGEFMFLVVMALVGMLLMSWAATGKGTSGLIRSAIGDIAAARQEYDAGKGTHTFTLEVKGRDNQHLNDVSGTYPVIGPFGESGFLIEAVEGPRSICKAGSCDWYAEHADLIQGAPEQTTTQTLTVKQTTAAALLGALEPLRDAGRVYLIGTVRSLGMKASEPAVQVSGEQVTLNYASTENVARWGRRTLRDLEITVQVRHKPGKAIPDISLESAASGLHPLLQAWVDRSK